MLNIGEFARFAGVSVRMLRHYDALGLLVPTLVDPLTGYRRYDAGLLTRAHQLVALKELGFSLEQVGDLLDAGPDQLRRLLGHRRAELRDQIAADRARLGEVERRLRLMEGKTMDSLQFVEKPLPAMSLNQLTGHVADVSEVGPTIGPLFDTLVRRLGEAGVPIDAPGIAWYAEEGDGMRIAAAFPTDGHTPAGLEAGELPAADRAFTTVYRGSMTHIGEAWQDLARHVEARGLEFVGPCREVYLQTPEDDPDGWVTELQQPVA